MIVTVVVVVVAVVGGVGETVRLLSCTESAPVGNRNCLQKKNLDDRFRF